MGGTNIRLVPVVVLRIVVVVKVVIVVVMVIVVVWGQFARKKKRKASSTRGYLSCWLWCNGSVATYTTKRMLREYLVVQMP